MPINDTYIVPAPIVEYLCNHERSFLGLRLVYGLLYILDTAVKGQMSLVASRFGGVHNVRLSHLGAAVGPAGAKDNRWLHAACSELSRQNLLRSADIHGRILRFRLSKNFLDAFAQPSKAFAIMRTEQVRQCKTLHDLMFLLLACLHGNKNRPLFLLPRIHRHLEQPANRLTLMPQKPPEQDAWRASWAACSRSWGNAAERVSGMLGHNYLIAPRQDMIDDFVSEVSVKIQSPTTTWERGKLYKFHPGTRSVIEITSGNKRTKLNMKAVIDKWHQQEVK